MPKNELPTIIDPYTNELRVLGTIPSDPRLVASIPPYTGTLLPESELQEFNDYPDHLEIKDQNGKGACNGFATAAALEQTRYVQGMKHVPLSGWFTYAILCNGRDVGSNILQAYAQAQEIGVAPESTVDYGIINPKNLTPRAHKEAQKYRLRVGASYQSWRQIVSSVMLRENLNLSVCVGRNFNNLDQEGVAGLDRGPGNHAVTVGLGLKKSKRWGWLVLMRNSWSPRWGQSGFCYLAEAHIEAGSYFECFSVHQVSEDLEANELPPIAKLLANLPRKATWTPVS